MPRYPVSPGLVMAAGCFLLIRAGQQQEMHLRAPLENLPAQLAGYTGVDLTISEGEQRVAGMSDYLLRSFAAGGDTVAVSLYVGYYASQTQGRSIHSPKNCLPGAGWEVISSGSADVRVEAETFRVNRYVIGRQGAKAVVYYWYQGRGRVSANEYRVKWELLRDKAFLKRSDEALVRIVVPMYGEEQEAEQLAEAAAAEIIPEVFAVLPTR